jgi:hypothetical protein
MTWLLILTIFIVTVLIVVAVVLALKFTGHLSSGTGSNNNSGGTTSGAPSAPTGLQSGFVSTNSVALTWIASTAATKYNVSYQLSTATTWTSFVSTSDTTVTITGLNPSTAYNFEVIAVNSIGSSSAAVLNGLQTASPPPQPTNFAAGTITTTSIALSWTASSGASSYTVNYQVSGASSWTTASSTITNTNTTITGLTSGTTYNFQLIATNSSGNGNPVPLNGIVTGAVPALPSGITVTSVTAGSVGLNWSPVNGAANYSVSYQVSGGSSWTPFGNAAGTSIVVVNLTTNTIYNFQVVANNSYGSSTPGVLNSIETTTAPSGTPPASPTNLTDTATGATSITLGWDSMSGATSYNISYQTLGAVGWTAYQTVTTTNVVVQGLTVNTTYNFQVSSANTYGVSNPSTLSNIETIPPPGAVTGLAAGTITTTSVGLSWNGSGTATSYTVNYQTSGATIWTAFGSPITSASVVVTGLTSGTSYNFEVISNNSSGPSAPAILNNITTGAPPSPPTSFQAGSLTSTTVPLVWTASSGTGITYTVSYQISGGSSWTQFGGAVSTTSTTVTGLTSGTTYSFQIIATNAYGSSSPQYLNNILTPTLPGQPGSLQSGTITSSSVVLNWLSATQATGYSISYQISGSGATWMSFQTTTGNTCTVTGLTGSTTYNFQVIATNSFGSGTPSILSGIVTPDPPITIPVTPTGVTMTQSGVGNGGEATLGWNASPGATSYTLSYTAAGNTHTYGSVSGTSVTFGGNPNYSYSFSLTANNSAGSSAPATLTLPGSDF